MKSGNYAYPKALEGVNKSLEGPKFQTVLCRIEIDDAKQSLHGNQFQIIQRKRQLSRGKWLKVLYDTIEPGTEIGMEACAGAHHWARQLIQSGYLVKIIPPLHMLF